MHFSLFVAGPPACGKSTFCTYLKNVHDLAHFDADRLRLFTDPAWQGLLRDMDLTPRGAVFEWVSGEPQPSSPRASTSGSRSSGITCAS